jgi:hypothetical protein
MNDHISLLSNNKILSSILGLTGMNIQLVVLFVGATTYTGTCILGTRDETQLESTDTNIQSI